MTTHQFFQRPAAVAWPRALTLALCLVAVRGAQADPPAEGDYTAAALRAYQAEVYAKLGGKYLDIPLEAKALYFRWLLDRYHFTPDDQISTRVTLPAAPGQPVPHLYGRDSSTWNGAGLAALSYEYAVTKNRQTLGQIARLVRGLHLYQQVTGSYGLAARCVVRSPVPIDDAKQKYVAPDGTVYHYHTEPAKGTYNQLAAGYAALMMHAYDDLPIESQLLAHADMCALAVHLVDHEYQLTEADGKPTPYGDLTPRMGPLGMPFNAQVAYMIVSTAAYYPPTDGAARERIMAAFRELRDKHHVYYEDPRRHLIRPQQVGASMFVKGMNDRFHVTCAAYAGLRLEIHAARTAKRPVDTKFLYELGQTMHFSLSHIGDKRNSLCNFMWTGMLAEPDVFSAIVPHEQDAIRRQFPQLVDDGIAQLRHFPLTRLWTAGGEVDSGRTVWVDEFRPDDYQWKHNPQAVWQSTGQELDVMTAAIDYLQAYWLMRLYKLDEHAGAAKHAAVLGKQPQ